MKRGIIACACGLLMLPPAFAGEPVWTGALQAEYDTTSVHSVDSFTFAAGGSLMGWLADPGIAFQLDGNVGLFRVQSALSVGQWSGGAHAFRPEAWGRYGLSVGYGARAGSDVGQSTTQFGAFAEWYALPDLTLRAHGGGLDRDNAQNRRVGTNWFGGAGTEYYLMPNLGIAAQYDFADAGTHDVSRWGASLELQFSRDVPLSLSGAYEHADGDFYGTDASNTIMIRLKYRFGTTGSLLEQDRTGPSAWTGLYLSPGSIARAPRPSGMGAGRCWYTRSGRLITCTG